MTLKADGNSMALNIFGVSQIIAFDILNAF